MFLYWDHKIKIKLGADYHLIDTWLVKKKRWLLIANEKGIFYKKRADAFYVHGFDTNSIVNKNVHFQFRLKEIFPSWDFSSVHPTAMTDDHIIVRDMDGNNYSVKLNNLLQGKTPTIESCINPTKLLIQKFNLIHDNKYQYIDFKYKNIHSNIDIICPTHGLFKASITNHLRIGNCRKCFFENHSGNYQAVNKNKFDKIFIYHLKLESENTIFYKIGLSNNPRRRLKEIIRSGRLVNGEILETIKGSVDELALLEKSFHDTFKDWGINYYPKELKSNGATECYVW